MNELKARVVQTVRTYRRLPGRVGPAGHGSSMPAYLYEPGDYGPAERVVAVNPETGRDYETAVTRMRPVVTSQELQDADMLTHAVARLSEEHRLAIWSHAEVKLDKRRTFSAEAKKMGIKRQELWRRIDRAFQALAVVIQNNGDCMQPQAVALEPEITEEGITIGHDTFWRGFTKLDAAEAGPVDFSKFRKSA